MPAALGTAYFPQLYSTWVSGGFIPPPALSNRETAGLISSLCACALPGAFFKAFLAHALWQRKRISPPEAAIAAPLATLAVLVVAYALLIREQPLARGAIVARDESPLSSLVHSVVRCAGLSFNTRLNSMTLNTVRPSSAGASHKNGVSPRRSSAIFPRVPTSWLRSPNGCRNSGWMYMAVQIPACPPTSTAGHKVGCFSQTTTVTP